MVRMVFRGGAWIKLASKPHHGRGQRVGRRKRNADLREKAKEQETASQ